MSKTEKITTADIATVTVGQRPVGPKVMENGNAILTCVECKGEVDKGCPPIPGQDDSGFRCAECQGKKDTAKLKAIDEAALAAAGGPTEISAR